MPEPTLHDIIITDPRFLMAYDPYGNHHHRSTRYAFKDGERSTACTQIGDAQAIRWIITHPPTLADWQSRLQDADADSMGAKPTPLRHSLFPCPTCLIRECVQDHTSTTRGHHVRTEDHRAAVRRDRLSSPSS